MTFVLTSVLNSFSLYLSHSHTLIRTRTYAHTHTLIHTLFEAQARVGLDHYLWYILKRGMCIKEKEIC